MNKFWSLDDIVIVTSIFEEYLKWLERVSNKILETDLTYINPDKYEFYHSQIQYLGFIVQWGYLTIPEKARPILDYPILRNLKQLHRFQRMSS